jgi:PIN domain nuclease of toxin-antitoxin system
VIESAASLVLDTHALLWHLADSPSISSTAKAAIASADDAGFPLYVSAMSLVEIRYLVEKGALHETAEADVLHQLQSDASPLSVFPVDTGVAATLPRVPRRVLGDPSDRLIVSTAMVLEVPLVTVDRDIHAAGLVPTVW